MNFEKIYDSNTIDSILRDKFITAYAIKEGIPHDIFREIKSKSPFDELQWSKFLNINIRTLQRYNKSQDHVFKPLQSERIFELAEVVILANKVFDSNEDFYLWLNTPSPALRNEKPIKLLDSSYGKDLIMAELNNIEYGNFL